ncbi:E3 ubiquitin-protein ligase rnf168 [Callorhinchus milii]|uniref:E3 ubiquitin-protein ligase rnf168 n=1 Tax=Callorhinchus milii TaxID=7868 RepID=UPI001C3FCA26|nr:E3 ubiquitin-protein ligase rnf168 [Callorhinchus milii]
MADVPPSRAVTMRRSRSRTKRSGPSSPAASPVGAPEPPPLTRSECLCPVCQELLLEPVTPPCGHSLCLDCFQKTVQISNLTCPLCRRRLSNWARRQARSGGLVNTALGKRIREQFRGESHGAAEESRDIDRSWPTTHLSKPGEVRQEYEDQILKFKAERVAREEEEFRASENLIQKLMAEEQQEKVLLEQRRKEVEEQLKKDEELAKKLSDKMNSASVRPPERTNIDTSLTGSKSTSSKVTKGSNSTVHNSGHVGDIHRYFSPTTYSECPETRRQKSNASAVKTCDDLNSVTWFKEQSDEYKLQKLPLQCSFQCEDSENTNETTEVQISEIKERVRFSEDALLTGTSINSTTSNGENGSLLDSVSTPTLKSEVNNYYGSQTAKDKTVSNHTVTALKEQPIQVEGIENQTLKRPSIKLKEVLKRKTFNSSEIPEETTFTPKKKRIYPCSDNNEFNEDLQVANEISYMEQHAEWEKEKCRLEEQDRELALQLQRKFDRETTTINRQRGSPDEYQLRVKNPYPINSMGRPNQHQSNSLRNSNPNSSQFGKKQKNAKNSKNVASRLSRPKRKPRATASQVSTQRSRHQKPLKCLDGNSAKLGHVNRLKNKQQTLIEMIQKMN